MAMMPRTVMLPVPEVWMVVACANVMLALISIGLVPSAVPITRLSKPSSMPSAPALRFSAPATAVVAPTTIERPAAVLNFMSPEPLSLVSLLPPSTTSLENMLNTKLPAVRPLPSVIRLAA